MKKNNLSLMIGPPSVPPNMFQRTVGFASTSVGSSLFSHWLAFSLSLRKNSHASPWKRFVPDLIDALTMPPMKLPNSADALFVMRLNSWMESGVGVKDSRLSEVWLLSIPSRMKLLDCSRFPLMNGRAPLFVLSPLLNCELSG